MYEGEVEQLASATSAGIGVRVIAGNRQGFAYAGSARRGRAGRDARRGARQRHLRHARRVAGPGRARRRRRPGPRPLPREPGQGLHRAEDRPGRRARAGRCGPSDTRITGVDAADYADGVSEGAVGHHHRHPGRPAARRPATCRRRAWPRTATTPRPASASRWAARPRTSTSRVAAADAARRATRLLGRHPARRAGGSPSCSTRTSPPSSWASSAPRCRARPCSRAGRCSPTGSARRWPPPRSRWSTTPPTRWPTARRETDGEGLASRRNVLIDGGRLAAVRAQRLHGPPVRHRRPPPTPCGASRPRRRSGCRALSLAPGTKLQPELLADGGRRRADQLGVGPALGRQPGVGRLLHRRRGPAHHRRRAGRAAAGVHHRLDAPADAGRGRRPSAPTSSGCRCAPPA